MERDTADGRDMGRELTREVGDEPSPAVRDTAPERLTPIDPNAPVSGHAVPPTAAPVVSRAPENDWPTAAERIFPLLRPAGTAGLATADVDFATITASIRQAHSQPIVDEGPAGLAVVYAIAASGFDVIVNADHLVSWGVDVAAVQDTAIRNLEAWSARVPWTEESSGARRLLSSDSGDGWDATRILLPEVRAHLASELGQMGRVLVGLPERHLLLAGALRPGDDEFAVLFQDFVVEHSGGADEPVDRRVFELVDSRLVEFAG
ncbi:MAG TPA: hypothetical protein VIV06_06530 [Candidatus Limnocylindrales bacterium]